MSHYAKIATKMTCSETLKEALITLGFAGNKIEIHEKPVQIDEGETAHVIIRKQEGFFKDIGWFIDQSGKKSKSFIDTYGCSNKVLASIGVRKFADKLQQEYAVAGIIRSARQQRKPFRRVEKENLVQVFVGA